ncbi:MAG: MlaE family lipid ABC transporter permease subunit [Proteobacteria bacterium]|nr:MlaE family lipid ABC transporter permease subunit [Pseudomonadota bacterium]
MTTIGSASSPLFEMTHGPEGKITLHVSGRMDFESSSGLIASFSKIITQRSPQVLGLNLENVTYFDDYGALVIEELQETMKSIQGRLEVEDPREITKNILSYVGFAPSILPPEHQRPELKIAIQAMGENALSRAKAFKEMVSFLGSLFTSLITAISHPGKFRMGDMVTAMNKTGVNALPIVALISFLLGLVMAFMSSIQLKQFGANIYVASLVAIAMVSELGPIMTAIVVAGRSGSAFAAEIGTMKISDEIDAIETMGFEPTLFLALPRVVASLLVVPILTLFSNLAAIAGGLFVGVTMLNLSTTTYISQTLDTLTLFEINWGMMKSCVFALIIATVGCLRGFQAKGGADAVGNAATSAVVTSIFLIILADSFFAIVRSQW